MVLRIGLVQGLGCRAVGFSQYFQLLDCSCFFRYPFIAGVCRYTSTRLNIFPISKSLNAKMYDFTRFDKQMATCRSQTSFKSRPPGGYIASVMWSRVSQLILRDFQPVVLARANDSRALVESYFQCCCLGLVWSL